MNLTSAQRLALARHVVAAIRAEAGRDLGFVLMLVDAEDEAINIITNASSRNQLLLALGSSFAQIDSDKTPYEYGQIPGQVRDS